MLTFILLLAHPGVGYTHCGTAMDWDVLRASYVCGVCGSAR